MTLRQSLWLGLAAVLLSAPAFYFFFTAPNSLPFWVSLVGPALFIQLVRSSIERKATYAEQLLPYVSGHGFEIISSTPLEWFSTGPFPKVHVFSQPYVSTTTPLGSGEFVEYRRLVLRDTSGSQYTTYALLEFRAFRCTKVLFEPALESLRSNNFMA
ncbi:MAG: hypothetical protein ACLQUR_01845 [Limisphaerales bacterium]